MIKNLETLLAFLAGLEYSSLYKLHIFSSKLFIFSKCIKNKRKVFNNLGPLLYGSFFCTNAEAANTFSMSFCAMLKKQQAPLHSTIGG